VNFLYDDIRRNNAEQGPYAVHGHSRLSILVLIKSSYMTSY